MINNFAGILFSDEKIDEILIDDFVRIVTVNNEYIYNFNNDINFKKTLTKAVFVCDGRIPFLFSKFIRKKKIVNITGNDIIKFVHSSGRYNSVLFIGDTDEVNFEIVEFFNNSGFRAKGWNPIIENIQDLKLREDFFNYDAVFVALGCVKQEKFINHFINDMIKNKVKVVAGIGGAYSMFLNKKRLPDFVYNIGLGSFWRLFQEFKWFRILRILISIKAFKYYLK